MNKDDKQGEQANQAQNKWTWISGWGIDPKQFRDTVETFFPKWKHRVIPPKPDALEEALGDESSRLSGYSLGSLLILNRLDSVPLETEVFCFAPILSLLEGKQLGGKISEALFDSVASRFEKTPDRALKIFYRLAGLNRIKLSSTLPYDFEDMRWGLRTLHQLRTEPERLERVQAILGTTDPLLDHDVLKGYFPNIQSADCGHDYLDLFEAFCTRHT